MPVTSATATLLLVCVFLKVCLAHHYIKDSLQPALDENPRGIPVNDLGVQKCQNNVPNRP